MEKQCYPIFSSELSLGLTTGLCSGMLEVKYNTFSIIYGTLSRIAFVLGMLATVRITVRVYYQYRRTDNADNRFAIYDKRDIQLGTATRSHEVSSAVSCCFHLL
jgi:hypothetical protein